MKTLILTLALGLTAHAGEQTEVTVRFHQSIGVGATFLPAGTYTIRAIDSSSNTPVLAFISRHGETMAVPVMRFSTSEPVADKTSFTVVAGDPEQDSGRVHMTAIRIAGRDYEYEIFSPRTNREPSGH